MYFYVYRITNTLIKKHYYGKRTSKILPEADLGIKYFSSSLDKSFIEDQKANPQNYKYKIVSTFLTAEKALEKEIKLHNKFNVGTNPHFYNKAKQTSTGFDRTGLVTVKDSIGNTYSVPADDPRYLSGELIGVTKGAKLSKERVQQIINKLLGRKHSEETKAKIKAGSLLNKGKRSTKEAKEKRAATWEQKIADGWVNPLKGRKVTDPSILARIKESCKNRTYTEESKMSFKQKLAKVADVYDNATNTLIAKSVYLKDWCLSNGYTPTAVAATARADRSKPSIDGNPHHHKGIYAIYV